MNNIIVKVALLLLFFAVNVLAKPVNDTTIESATLNWIKLINDSKTRYSIDRDRVTDTNSSLYDSKGNPIAYKFVYLNPKGWVLVSRDDALGPILGYSLEGNISSDSPMPEALIPWLEEINHAVAAINKKEKRRKNTNRRKKEKKLYRSSKKEEKRSKATKEKTQRKKDNFTYNSWEVLSANPKEFNRNTKSILTVGPLLTTKWSQDTYYNSKCPEDNFAVNTNHHVKVGCVATAMAQLMRYHEWPTKGTGSHGYTHPKYGILHVDFNTTYHWSLMPDSISGENEQIATISYHAGVSVSMNYDPTGSSTSVSKIPNALKSYFSYKSKYAIKADFTPEEWEDMIIDNLNNNQPIIYRGRKSSSWYAIGHAFVCDGYQDIGNNDKSYHFNWGWSGNYNGWYALNNLKTGAHSWNYKHTMVYDIEPDTNTYTVPNEPLDLHVQNLGSESAELVWIDNASDEWGYKVLNGSGAIIAYLDANATQYSLENLLSSKTYTYSVAAYNQGGDSPKSTVSFTTQAGILPAPTNLHATNITATTADLIWKDNSNNETKFYIYKGDSKIDSVNSNETTYHLHNLLVDEPYLYRVRAHNDNGESSPDTVAFHTLIPMPIIKTFYSNDSYLTTNSTRLYWNCDGIVEKYKLYKENSNMPFAEPSWNGKTGQTFDLTNLTPATEYTIRMTAENFSGVSPEMNTTFRTFSDIGAPSNLTISNVTSNSAKLSWVDNSDSEIAFNIYRIVGSSSGGSTLELIDSVEPNVTQYNYTELEPSTSYTIYVRAVDVNNFETKETKGSFFTLPGVPFAPTNFKVDFVGFYNATLFWTDNSSNEKGFSLACSGLNTVDIQKNITSYPLTDLTPNTEYTCQLSAYNNVGTSDIQTVTFHTYESPKLISPNPGATLNNCGSIFFKWSQGYGVKKVYLTIYDTSNPNNVIFAGNFDPQVTTKTKVKIKGGNKDITVELKVEYDDGTIEPADSSIFYVTYVPGDKCELTYYYDIMAIMP